VALHSLLQSGCVSAFVRGISTLTIVWLLEERWITVRTVILSVNLIISHVSGLIIAIIGPFGFIERYERNWYELLHLFPGS
jgi:uncharacterized membrane protein